MVDYLPRLPTFQRRLAVHICGSSSGFSASNGSTQTKPQPKNWCRNRHVSRAVLGVPVARLALKNWVVATQTFFIFNPKIGEDEPILTHIFQMGWNHQLEKLATRSQFLFPKKVLHWSSFRIAPCQWKYLNGTGCNLWILRLNLSFPTDFASFLHLSDSTGAWLLVAPTSAVMAETMWTPCSAPEVALYQRSRCWAQIRQRLVICWYCFFFCLLPGSSVLSFAAFGLNPLQVCFSGSILLETFDIEVVSFDGNLSQTHLESIFAPKNDKCKLMCGEVQELLRCLERFKTPINKWRVQDKIDVWNPKPIEVDSSSGLFAELY